MMFDIKKNESERHYEVTLNGELMAKVYFGSGIIFDEVDVDYDNLPDWFSELYELLEDLSDEAKKELFILPKDVVAAIEAYVPLAKRAVELYEQVLEPAADEYAESLSGPNGEPDEMCMWAADDVLRTLQKEQALSPELTAALQEYDLTTAKAKSQTNRISEGISKVVSDFDEDAFMNDPIQNLSPDCVVEGVEATGRDGRIFLKTHGMPLAGKDSGGIYCCQQCGHMGDDYTGYMFLRMRQGTNGDPDQFLRVYYEC